jgi:hypothetical protein
VRAETLGFQPSKPFSPRNPARSRFARRHPRSICQSLRAYSTNAVSPPRGCRTSALSFPLSSPHRSNELDPGANRGIRWGAPTTDLPHGGYILVTPRPSSCSPRPPDLVPPDTERSPPLPHGRGVLHCHRSTGSIGGSIECSSHR